MFGDSWHLVSVHHLSSEAALSWFELIIPTSVVHLASVTAVFFDIYSQVVVSSDPPSLMYAVAASVPVHPVAMSFQSPMFTSCVVP